MTHLSFVMPYYRNPLMLAHQYGAWCGYPEGLKAQVEIVLVDDGSPEEALDVPRPDGLPPLRIFRVCEDKRWNQHAARNIGAHEAHGEWLFLTDMDHVLPTQSAQRLLGAMADGDRVLTFDRVDAPHLRPKLTPRGDRHPHQNTFAVTKSRYWAAGGYDEDFCGIYGTDGYFLTRLFRGALAKQLDVPVIRYPREVIADASTRDPDGGDPTAYRDAYRQPLVRNRLLAEKSGKAPRTLSCPYVRVL